MLPASAYKKNRYKNILCIRADNMGDIVMSGPALRALKATFHCRLTLLTSQMGSLVTPFIPEIDATIITDLPWVKTNSQPPAAACQDLVDILRRQQFDLAVIFTVYSQNPLPSALLCFLADIPERLAYCRENPYHLLTKWIPDQEPYTLIRHQVERDLHLVASIGARTTDDRLRLTFSATAKISAEEKLASIGVDLSKPYIILHPGVSEKKREYPLPLWADTAELIRRHTNFQLIVTGSSSEKIAANHLAANIPAGQADIPSGIFVTAGLLTLEEFIAVIAGSRLVISVNTAATHIAAAVDTPVIVLYARTNPQHTPWNVPAEVLEFSVSDRSRNEVIRHVTDNLYNIDIPFPEPQAILSAVRNLLKPTRKTEEHGQVADSFK